MITMIGGQGKEKGVVEDGGEPVNHLKESDVRAFVEEA